MIVIKREVSQFVSLTVDVLLHMSADRRGPIYRSEYQGPAEVITELAVEDHPHRVAALTHTSLIRSVQVRAQFYIPCKGRAKRIPELPYQ